MKEMLITVEMRSGGESRVLSFDGEANWRGNTAALALYFLVHYESI
jgi:hypothetical protein